MPNGATSEYGCWKGCGRRQWWPYLSWCFSVCLKGLTINTKGRDNGGGSVCHVMNSALLKYERGTLHLLETTSNMQSSTMCRLGRISRRFERSYPSSFRPSSPGLFYKMNSDPSKRRKLHVERHSVTSRRTECQAAPLWNTQISGVDLLRMEFGVWLNMVTLPGVALTSGNFLTA